MVNVVSICWAEAAAIIIERFCVTANTTLI